MEQENDRPGFLSFSGGISQAVDWPINAPLAVLRFIIKTPGAIYRFGYDALHLAIPITRERFRDGRPISQKKRVGFWAAGAAAWAASIAVVGYFGLPYLRRSADFIQSFTPITRYVNVERADGGPNPHYSIDSILAVADLKDGTQRLIRFGAPMGALDWQQNINYSEGRLRQVQEPREILETIKYQIGFTQSTIDSVNSAVQDLSNPELYGDTDPYAVDTGPQRYICALHSPGNFTSHRLDFALWDSGRRVNVEAEARKFPKKLGITKWHIYGYAAGYAALMGKQSGLSLEVDKRSDFTIPVESVLKPEGGRITPNADPVKIKYYSDLVHGGNLAAYQAAYDTYSQPGALLEYGFLPGPAPDKMATVKVVLDNPMIQNASLVPTIFMGLLGTAYLRRR